MKPQLIFLTLFILFIGCSDDESTPAGPVETEVEPLRVTITRDIGNGSSSSDVGFVFRTDETISGEIRVFFVKSGTELIADEVSTLSEDQYLVVTADQADDFLRFKGGMLDSDGESIENNTFYSLQLFAIDQDLISSPSRVFVLKNVGILKGSYTGSWTDNLYTDFQVSFAIEGSNGDYDGEFFYTAGFRSCCNGAGENDGTVSISSNFDQITRFRYNQFLSQFTGVNGTNYQNCSGNYSGSGTFNFQTNVMEIEFSGSDCEGGHTGGILVMKRQND